MQHTDGAPVAVELHTPAIALAREFYSALLGWDIADADGGALAATFDGDTVATLRSAEQAPAGWRVVFAGSDADATHERVTTAGGAVVATDDGGVLVINDPLGATSAVDCSGERRRLQPGPSRPSWFEIMTTDAPTTDAFYRDVLQVQPIDPEGGEAASAPFALLIGGDGEPVGGRLTLPPELAQALGDRWMIYFAVADVDAFAAAVPDLGGVVAVGPMDAPTGRLAAIVDPSGGVFTLLRPAERG